MNITQEHIMPVLTAIIGVAILAVIVSRRSATADVIRAAGGAFGGLLGIAISPITGQNNGNSGAGGFGPFTPNVSGGNVTMPNINFPNITLGGAGIGTPPINPTSGTQN